MDHHDAAEAFAAELRQQLFGGGDLRVAQGAGRKQRRLGHAAVQADQRDRPAPAHRREDLEIGGRRLAVARHVGAPQARAPRATACRDIDVVVAGNDRDLVRRAERSPATCEARANSSGSEMFTRSPVSAMWSGFCALMSATMPASASGRWSWTRLRHQL